MEISRNNRTYRANGYAGGFKPFLDPVRAKMALLNRSQIFIQKERIVRAGLHTGPTTDTRVSVNINDAILSLRKGFNGANGHARRIRALVASLNQKIALDLWKFANFNVFDVRSKPANGNIVFRFAGNGAGMAPNTGFLVDYKPVLHRWSLLKGNGDARDLHPHSFAMLLLRQRFQYRQQSPTSSVERRILRLAMREAGNRLLLFPSARLERIPSFLSTENSVHQLHSLKFKRNAILCRISSNCNFP